MSAFKFKVTFIAVVLSACSATDEVNHVDNLDITKFSTNMGDSRFGNFRTTSPLTQEILELCEHEKGNTTEITKLLQGLGLWNIIPRENSNRGCSGIDLMRPSKQHGSSEYANLCSLLKNNQSLESIHSKVLVSGDCWAADKPEMDTFTYVIIAILSGVLFFSILITIVQPCHKRRLQKEEAIRAEKERQLDSYLAGEPINTKNRFLAAFSIAQNVKYWSDAETNVGQIRCVDGIRFLTMCWLILLFTFLLCPIEHTKELIRTYPGWSLYLILTAHFSSDTFFTISSILVTYNTLRGLDRKELMAIVRPFIRRLFRFLPTYAAVIFTSASIIPLLNKHNLYLQENAYNCRVNWWTNLLFINNIVHSETSSTCHQETWYLAADMQFFVASLVLILILWLNRIIGLGLIFALILGAIASPTVLTVLDELIPSPINLILQNNLTPEEANKYIDFYIKPWNRAGPYLVGIIGGYVLHELGKKDKSSKPSIPFAVIGWTLSTIGALALIYGLHISHDFANESVGEAGSAVYGGLHSISWSCIIVWVVIACNQGYGGWINDFLAWSAFKPLAKLTFCVFLVSTNVQLVFHLFQHDTKLPTSLTMTGYFFAHLTASLVVGLVLHVIVQVPFVKMGNRITKGAETSQNDGGRGRVPRERFGIYYTGKYLEAKNHGIVNVNEESVQERQRPSVQNGVDDDGLKSETVINIDR